jgi:hypothetical protein
MRCASKGTRPASQPFPSSGALASAINLSLPAIEKRVASYIDRPLYAYIVTTVKNRNGRLAQTGSAPNFQGSRITLCTCKHKDRVSPPPDGYRGPGAASPWKGVWVAGLCSPSQFRPRALFYLMLVEQVCDSHAAAWAALGKPLKKSAHRDFFGDIYEPLSAAGSAPYCASSYAGRSAQGHVHGSADRKKDIETMYYGRRPKLLIGEPRQSYLWEAPLLRLITIEDRGWSSAHHGFYKTLGEFLKTFR